MSNEITLRCPRTPASAEAATTPPAGPDKTIAAGSSAASPIGSSPPEDRITRTSPGSPSARLRAARRSRYEPVSGAK